MFNFLISLAVIYVLWRNYKMSAELRRLQAETAEITTVVDSAVAMIEGLAAQVRDNANDPAALNALADQLDANANRLGAAIASNTPATSGDEVEELSDEDLEPIVSEDTTGTGGGESGGQPTT